MSNKIVSKSSRTKSGRNINRSNRWIPSPQTTDGRKVYRLGKTQKDIVDELPQRRPFTRREVRDIGESLGLTQFRTDHVFDGIVGRNYAIALKGKRYRKGTGEKLMQ